MTIIRAVTKALVLFGDDLFVLLGLALICWATFLLSFIAGLYVVGAMCIGLAIIFSKVKPPKRR